MIPYRIDTFEKFKNYFLTMFLKESFGMIEHFDIYYSEMQNISDVQEDFNERFDIFCKKVLKEKATNEYGQIDFSKLNDSDNYFTINGVNPGEYEDNTLDIIGKIFGVSRKVYVDFVDPENVITSSAVTRAGITFDPITREGSGWIKLNNYCFLLYIQCEIFKQTFSGTKKDLEKIYENITNEKETKINLPKVLKIKYVWNMSSDSPGNCHLILNKEVSQSMGSNTFAPFGTAIETAPIVMMFLSGMLQIESLGINYLYSALNKFVSYLMLSGGETYTTPQLHSAVIRDITPGSGVNFNFDDSIGVLL